MRRCAPAQIGVPMHYFLQKDCEVANRINKLYRISHIGRRQRRRNLQENCAQRAPDEAPIGLLLRQLVCLVATVNLA
ncbi:hypothetical protein BRAS3843_1430007 [Bradyrhizobium sp. STM 3843]|nr:hypothetical protein BRAS3843_1430007 [Bradyrhizobium sp. STM 3843]